VSKAATRIRKGLEQAISYAKGTASPHAYRVHVPAHVDVKAIREKLGMTQRTFALDSASASTRSAVGNRESASQKGQPEHTFR
jgi:DNA-binding transcriptional regulator YiaG